jgi:protein regulator of cytokinesis 1
MQYIQSDRLQRVLGYVNDVHSLCGVLGIDFGKTVNGVHPSLHQNGVGQSRNISNSTLEGLASTISNLKAERKSRIDKVLSSFYSFWVFFLLSLVPHNQFSNNQFPIDERHNGIIMSALENNGLF